jgi:hypothetical protein
LHPSCTFGEYGGTATADATGALPASGDPLRFGDNAIWGEWFTGGLDEMHLCIA